jgi:hypothetical protein
MKPTAQALERPGRRKVQRQARGIRTLIDHWTKAGRDRMISAMSDAGKPLEILGPPFFAVDAEGRLISRLGTLFPRHRTLVTLPGVHASQRLALVDHLNAQRRALGDRPLTFEEEEVEMAWSVDLFFDPDRTVLIRPDPDNMVLAFEGDVLLQEVVAKQNIKFLFVFNTQVQQRIKERGECWRISPLPRSPEAIRKLVAEAKVAIAEGSIYYYNRANGTRYLTVDEFSRLGALETGALARQLMEIAVFSRSRNRLGNLEVDFFPATPMSFGAKDLADARFAELPESDVRAIYEGLRQRFREAVSPEFRVDDPAFEPWRNRMYTLLVSEPSETLTEEILRGLSPEFFLQIGWLPGASFEEGEVVFDPIFVEADEHPEDARLQQLCDPRARGFIFNFIREYGDLEYVNIGHIQHSLSKKRPVTDGHRDVYIAELKPRSSPQSVVRFIRLLKWGVRERLDEGKDLLRAILETEEYVDWMLDRRLGCRQLGMNLPSRVTIRRFSESYRGPREDLVGQSIRTVYSERDYIPGMATDKVPSWKYAQEDYARILARLLGRAAASNIIVGRTYDEGATVIFDDGDEVVVEGVDGLPTGVLVGDHSGAFGEWRQALQEAAKAYARPVNDRAALVPNPREFAELYLAGFAEWFGHVQGDYRKRRRAFDNLFRHCRYDPKGSFAYRWQCVLQRLDATDGEALVRAIRRHIAVLPGSAAR